MTKLRAALIAIILLCFACGYFGFVIFDLMDELSDCRRGGQWFRNEGKTACSLVLLLLENRKKSDLLLFLKQHFHEPAHLVKSEEDQLFLDDIIFRFRGDQLVDVHTSSSEGAN